MDRRSGRTRAVRPLPVAVLAFARRVDTWAAVLRSADRTTDKADRLRQIVATS